MSESSLVDRLRLARQALVLVSQGSSERSAISKAASSDPKLAREKSQALSLVIDVLTQIDLHDMAIRAAIPGVKTERSTMALFRLAAHLMLDRPADSKSNLVQALRRVSHDFESPRLELLLGRLVENGNPDPSLLASEEERVGLRTHNPPWWVAYCFHRFGRETGLKILSSPNRPRFVRLNSLRNRGRMTLPLEFRKSGGPLREVDPGVFELTGSPSRLANYFEHGLFQFQDFASFLAVKAADPAPEETVLDLCAAPGGKTANLAQLMKNRGNILSVDYSAARMATWARETERLGVKIASPLIQDASNLGLNEEFDLVLVDPPCTGTGIVDRNPGMKWHLSAKLVKKFSLLQEEMLDEASRYVRRGGRLVYCTCSLTIEENEMVVSKFLTAHADFETRPVLHDKGSPGLRGLSDCRRFYPYKDRSAGYFIARLERVLREV